MIRVFEKTMPNTYSSKVSMQNYYDAVLDMASICIWMIDKDYNLRSCNEHFQELMRDNFGVCPQIGESCVQGFPSRYKEEILFWKEKYDRGLGGERFAFQMEVKQGEGLKTVEISIRPVLDDENMLIVGLAICGKDISTEVQTAKALESTQTELSTSYQAAKIGRWKMDLNTCRVELSKEKQILMGEQAREMRTMGLEDFGKRYVHPDYLPLFSERVLAAIENIGNVDYKDSWEYQIIGSNQEAIYVREDITINQQGILIGITQDITEQKQKESEYKQLSEDLVYHNRHLEQFTYIVSHNLRAPISRIMAITEFLHHSLLGANKELTAYATMLKGEAERLDEMMYDLNGILALEKTNSSMEKILLSQCIHNVIVNNALEIQKNQAKIMIDVEESVKIWGYPSFLTSIFTQLLLNAIKYQHPDRKPVIVISYKEMNDFQSISVKDNGLGMDLKKIGSKIFGIYQRFHPQIEGKGMSLFICKTQMELMKGKIEVISAVDEGTTFCLHFANTPTYHK